MTWKASRLDTGRSGDIWIVYFWLLMCLANKSYHCPPTTSSKILLVLLVLRKSNHQLNLSMSSSNDTTTEQSAHHSTHRYLEKMNLLRVTVQGTWYPAAVLSKNRRYFASFFIISVGTTKIIKNEGRKLFIGYFFISQMIMILKKM